AGRGRLHGQRVRAHAPPGLRRAAGAAGRRRPHRARPRHMTAEQAGLAIDAFRRGATADVDRFLAELAEGPIVEGRSCPFLFRCEADEVRLVQRIVGLPHRLPIRRLPGTDLWYVVLDVPEGSRINYQIEVRRGGHAEVINDPLNPKHSHSPFGSQSVCFAYGYTIPEWTQPDPSAPPGALHHVVLDSAALGREAAVTVYLPA